MSGGGLNYLQYDIDKAIDKIRLDTDFERLIRDLLVIVRDMVEALDYYYGGDTGLDYVIKQFIFNAKKLKDISDKWYNLANNILDTVKVE